MNRLRLILPEETSASDAADAAEGANSPARDPHPFPSRRGGVPSAPASSYDEAIRALDSMSRRIDDLARELNCLGHFDPDDDRPRAA